MASVDNKLIHFPEQRANDPPRKLYRGNRLKFDKLQGKLADFSIREMDEKVDAECRYVKKRGKLGKTLITRGYRHTSVIRTLLSCANCFACSTVKLRF